MSDFRQTWLWRHSFVNPRTDCTRDEQKYFADRYVDMRDRTSHLVSKIAADMPYYTLHDITHLDALWDTASIVAEGAINVNPAEAFVFGASVLIHDAGMSLAAYPAGLSEVSSTAVWQDAIASLAEVQNVNIDRDAPPEEVIRAILPEVLRRLHAQHAEVLASQEWPLADGTRLHLIDDADIRHFYGPTIGIIAHSHWWPVHRIEDELREPLGAMAGNTSSIVDRVKLAFLLRIADAIHLDRRRAPRFLRAITNPSGQSALHWTFQERLASPHVELDALVFTSGQPFSRDDADAWWLAYDVLGSVDRELRAVDMSLLNRGGAIFRARRVKGAGSPEALARTITTKGWRPVDTRLRVTDVPTIVETLGGAKLYGSDLSIALRELIQNGSDAIQARRRLEHRGEAWGEIKVSLCRRDDENWLSVEDNGVGMSETVLTGPLLDFGTSFWRSELAIDEFPGLMAAGMQATGRFGIGFFSTFMLGPVVRVYTRRFDKAKDSGRLLEFKDGTSARPMLSPVDPSDTPIDGGTRVEVRLESDPSAEDGLLSIGEYWQRVVPLERLVGAVAPAIGVAVTVSHEDKLVPVLEASDWLDIAEPELVERIDPTYEKEKSSFDIRHTNMMRSLKGDTAEVFGRAYIRPSIYRFGNPRGWVAIGGLRASRLWNVEGVIVGKAITAARDIAHPVVPSMVLTHWATEQAQLISEHVVDEEVQARSAEVILECGGDIGQLKIIKLGEEWLDSSELAEHLRKESLFSVSFEGEFEFDEDADDVHPREFRDEFVLDSNQAYTIRHDGTILRSPGYIWPSIVKRDHESRLGSLIRDIARKTWDGNLVERRKTRAVGSVLGASIERDVVVLYPD